MKTKEELNALREEIAELNKKIAELSDEELQQVVGSGQFGTDVFTTPDHENLYNFHVYSGTELRDFTQKSGK